MANVAELQEIANRIRIDSIRMTTEAGSGHPTSSCSMAEIASTVFFYAMRHDPKNPQNPNNDRFVLSKGHAAPALYAVWKQLGLLSDAQCMSLRKVDSEIEGHPTPRLNFVDVATGSLGQGLSCAAGMAYLSKYIECNGNRVFVLMGDGESAEGSNWEAMHFASQHKLNNLVAIFDINRLGQSQATPIGHDMEVYRKRCEGFGFNTLVVDGHSVTELIAALDNAAQTTDKPTAIVCKTYKGQGIVGIADQDNWHGKPLPKDIAEKAVAELMKVLKNPGQANSASQLAPPPPANNKLQPAQHESKIPVQPPAYELGQKIATRFAYGTAIVKLGQASNKVVALDCDVKNSTFAIKFLEAFPQRFVECFIAEQNMVGVAAGMSSRKRIIPFVSTFGTFFTRAADQIRMASISLANVKYVGSHVGVSIGEDGTSQMGLEDISLFRSLPDSVVFYPSDAVAAENSLRLAAEYYGTCYIRTSRPATPVIYRNEEPFEIGKAKLVIDGGNGAAATIVAGGVTLYEAMKAADALSKEGIKVNVVDVFTVKPLDSATILAAAQRSNNYVVSVEDHYPWGGIGDAVGSAIAESGLPIKLRKLAVEVLPRSGKPEELIDMFGIGSRSIIAAVKKQ